MGRLLGVLPALLLLSACTPPEQRFADHLARGDSYAAEGEIQKALLEYHSALKIRPDDAELNERVGDLLVEQRSFQDAAFFYREAHRLDPSRSETALKEARALLPSDPRRAQRLVRQVVEEHPEDAFAQRTLSEVLVTQRKLDEAEQAAERATQLAPEDPGVWMQLGNVRSARLFGAQLTGNASDELFEAALEAFAAADEAAGGHVTARIDRARILAAWGGRREQAEQGFREAIELARSQQDRAAQVAASKALADQAESWGDRPLEREALRQLVEVSDDHIGAWQRLAALADDPKGARAVFSELLSRRPDDPRARLAYAALLIRSNQPDAAIVHLQEAIEDGVESAPLWEQLLILHLHKRQFADARATVVRMHDSFPDEPRTKRSRARLALATGRTADAAEILRSLVLEDEDFESQMLLAQAEKRLQNLKRASAAVDRAIALAQPRFSLEAAQLRARIHYDAKQWEETLAALDRIAARGHPLTGSYLVMRAISLYESGDPQAGRRELVRSLEMEPRVGAAIQYAHREGDGDAEGARRYLEAAFRIHPTHSSLLEELTTRDVRAGRTQAAIERLTDVIAKHRVAPSVLLLRADLLARSGDFDAAEADALRAFESAPGSPEALDLLFRLYVEQGNTEQAARSFRQAEDADVLHPGARLLLARLALHAGDVEEARRTYEKVLEERPDMASAQSDLALLLAREGDDLERAVSLARQAQKQLRDDPGAAYRLGYVYLRSGRPEQALLELRRAAQLAEERPLSGLAPTIYYHTGLALRALQRDREAIEAFESALALDSSFPEADDARRQIDGLRTASGRGGA